jgi:ketosteroid isomerase-like protein
MVQAPVGTNLRRMVETEISFARTAELRGTKSAFLSFLADDGVVFNPTGVNGKLSWKGRPESPALLSWHPAWADLSSDGSLGYTTGGWELRPKGKGDTPAAFGEYLTIWKRQPGGIYRAVLDIGIQHPSSSYSTAQWKSPADAGVGTRARGEVGNDTLQDIFSNKSMANGYFNYLADDVIVLRDGQMPFAGKKAAFIGLESLEKEFPNSSFLKFDANVSGVHGNMLYFWGVYSLTHKDKSVSRWNFVQIWKYRGGKWQIVADLFTAIPDEKKRT